MKFLAALLTLLCLPVMTPVSAQSRVQATLSLQQTSVLPGIPAAMRLTLANAGTVPYTVTDWFRLHVTPADSRPPFVAQNAHTNYVGVVPTLVPALTVPAGGTLQIDFPLTPLLLDVGFFADRRLSQPGEYRLRIELADPSMPAWSPAYQTLFTNEETLQVLEPSGADLPVWALMQQRTNGAGFGLMDWLQHGAEVAAAIYSQYGSSAYLPYVAYWVPTTKGAYGTRLGLVDRALGTGVQGPVREMLLLAKAEITVAWAGDAFYARRDIDVATSASARARTALDTLLAETTSAYMIARADKLAGEALTREEWEAKRVWLASLDNPPGAAPVAARVQCTRETGNRLEASFSYYNPNPVPVTIPVGARNRFAPAPENRRQPTSFLPGLHEGVVTVVIDAKKKDPSRTIAWTLDGATASAPFDGAPKCKKK